jgi:hypothetical protein
MAAAEYYLQSSVRSEMHIVLLTELRPEIDAGL